MIRDLEALAEMRGYCDAVVEATAHAVGRFTDMQQGLAVLVERHLEMRDHMRSTTAGLRRRSKAAEHYVTAADALEKARCAITAAGADAEALIETLENTIARLNTAAAAVATDFDLSPDETPDENL